MKFGVNREEGWFLSENFLPWTFCPRYIQPGLVGAFPKCLMAQAGPEGPSGEFLGYKSSLCSPRVDALNYNPRHPAFHLLAGEGGKRSAEMRSTPWLVLSVSGREVWRPLLPGRLRQRAWKWGRFTYLSLFVPLLSWWIIFLQRSGLLLAVEGSVTNGNSSTFKRVFWSVRSV